MSKITKDELDRWYTQDIIVDKCLERVDLSKYDMVIEPSAGDGSFIKKIKHSHLYAFDIFPNYSSITKANWFEIDKSIFSKNSIVIGNPPFGKNATLAISFFNEAATFAKTIAFILPASFHKISIIKKLDKHFHLEDEVYLERCKFNLPDGNSYSVDCVFQVWNRKDFLRNDIIKKEKTNIISFTNKENADFSIRRVGVNAGKASKTLDFANASNYFIKNTSKFSTDYLIDYINSCEFENAKWTVGPNSVTKNDIIQKVNLLIS